MPTLTQYANIDRTVLSPSGDVTGVKDAAAINASLIANAHTVLAPGNWYSPIGGYGMVTNSRWLQGSGAATIINPVTSGTGITLTGPGQVRVSDMAFNLPSGGLAIQVNGAYDSTFENLWVTGSSAAGGISVNGDDATEQNWVNVVMRGVGGVGFQLTRTTSIYTGSLYLDRVRCVQPPAGATGGILCTSSAGSASLNTITLNECVFDNYQGGDAGAFNNVAQVFVTDSWFAVNASATSKVALRITGGFQHTYKGNYTYTGLSPGTCVIVTGGAQKITFDGGHVFDGNSGSTAISASGLTAPSGLRLGDYQMFGVTILTDTPLLSTAIAYAASPSMPPADELMVPLKAGGELTFSRTLVSQNAIGMTKGQILFGPAQIATVTEAIGHISTITGSTAASGTPTYAGYGVYSVDPATGNLTLVASTTTSATLWDVSFQGINGINVKVAITFSKVAGTMYCVGKLFAGGAGVAPQVGGTTPDSGDTATNFLLPFRGAVSTSTSLTAHASITYANLTAISFQPFDVLLP